MRFTARTQQQNGFTTVVLTDNTTGCFTEIYSLGAIVNQFAVKTGNDTINVIDGFSSVEEAAHKMDSAFQSAKLSPFVCRMNKGEYSFDEQKYKIEKFYLGNNAIHGLLFNENFEVLNTHADDHYASVGLRFKYNATDKGYPFSYELLINWKLEEDNKLSVKTTAIHHNTTSIPFSDGWHPYFHLGETVNNCFLQFDADKQVEFNEELVPTGKTISDTRFENGMVLNDTFLDNCFVLKTPGTSACVLKNNKVQLTIQPDNHYPYLQVYTPLHRKSIAIENLSSAPDAFNNKMGLLLLEPNRQYSFTTSYQLTAL